MKKISLETSSQLTAVSYSMELSVPRYVAMAEMLLNEISEGIYPVGSKLPTEKELAEKFGVAYMTARRAIGILVQKGVISRQHGKGTFVQESGKQLLIGILVGPSLAEESAYFYRAIVRTLRNEIEANGWVSRTYGGLTDAKGMPQRMDASIVKQLRMDLNSRIFDGFIEIAPGVKGLKYVNEGLPLPTVKCEPTAHDNDLNFDMYDFGKSAVDYLVENGARNIAYIRPCFLTGFEQLQYCTDDLNGLFDAVKKHNLPSPCVESMTLTESIGSHEAEIYQKTLRFIENWSPLKKASTAGIIVNDDIAMRAVSAALLKATTAVQKGIKIVCFTNEEASFHYGVPLAKYEISLKGTSQKIIERLKVKIANGKPSGRPIVIAGTIAQGFEKQVLSEKRIKAESLSATV